MLHLTSELTTVKDQKRNVKRPSPLLSLGIELRNKTNIHLSISHPLSENRLMRTRGNSEWTGAAL